MSSKSFEGKVIAVTGAASGIGRGVATYLANRGASLALSDVQAGPLRNLAADLSSLGVRVIPTVVDVSNPTQVKDWIEQTVKDFGKLDGAANIAGTGGSTAVPLEAQTDKDWDLVIGINMTGTMYSMREELNHLTDGGSIVNASSVLGLRSSPGAGGSSYVASKHAVLGMTRQAAREYGHRGIRVNCVNPGAIDTPMMAHAKDDTSGVYTSPLGRWGQPEDVARLVGFLLGDESTFITGTSVVIDGGLTC
ncbi:3-oxoacyl-(acyl-carrier-protein) reductase [Colletotrichum plurivorum]|uniref:3-oxoacyl-(Acyl-carrier-protein) reductase n=1 Tax=Colletotrichum plurivorum TaxID=2175906 RepID=A0A8H6K727_9PEZI|nr:3-oxoacyl-(acyl-carrier-protein) reductase [Colletotrichum plurivorum]